MYDCYVYKVTDVWLNTNRTSMSANGHLLEYPVPSVVLGVCAVRDDTSVALWFDHTHCPVYVLGLLYHMRTVIVQPRYYRIKLSGCVT